MQSPYINQFIQSLFSTNFSLGKAKFDDIAELRKVKNRPKAKKDNPNFLFKIHSQFEYSVYLASWIQQPISWLRVLCL